MGTGGGWLGSLVSLGLLAGVLIVLGLGVAWFASRLRGATATAETGSDPLEIARRRLAAGEITAPEFEEIRSRLQS